METERLVSIGDRGPRPPIDTPAIPHHDDRVVHDSEVTTIQWTSGFRIDCGPAAVSLQRPGLQLVEAEGVTPTFIGRLQR